MNTGIFNLHGETRKVTCDFSLTSSTDPETTKNISQAGSVVNSIEKKTVIRQICCIRIDDSIPHKSYLRHGKEIPLERTASTNKS